MKTTEHRFTKKDLGRECWIDSSSDKWADINYVGRAIVTCTYSPVDAQVLTEDYQEATFHIRCFKKIGPKIKW
jgi:hypothetical protein